MKVLLISDTHGQHGFVKDLPKADAIVHAGDVSMRGYKNQVQNFLAWFESLDFEHKVFISGNHDFLFEKDPDVVKEILPPNVTYLENSGITINGINFYGSPISPWFHNWAFNRHRGADIKKYWDMIPENTNFLITHGPPYNVCDKVNNFYNHEQNVGCKDLKQRMFELKELKGMVFGHIHEARGYENVNGIHCFNASVLDDDYVVAYPPTLIEIDENSKEITIL